MKKLILATLSLIICLGANAQKFEGLAQTPQMGWNSWNKFAKGVNEQVIRETIDTMVELGFVDAGYVYMNIDDFWHGERDENGFITCDTVRFPSGIKALADYAHSKGMKFGLYSDAGTNTCGGCLGSLGHEYQDALQYARWGVDYLKYDWCSTTNIDPKGAYTLMRNALAAAGRPIFFSMCEWGNSKPWEWAAEVGHSWRTTGDICASFNKDIEHFDPGNYWKQLSITSIVDFNEPLRKYAGPGHWNDPDMLEVGNGMTLSEDRAHFTLWCMMAAPLLMGNDLTTMSEDVRNILLNKAMIAVDQDPLGIQGLRYKVDGNLEYWFKPLSDGDWAFVIFNRGDKDSWCTVDWSSFSFTDDLSGRSTAFDSTVYGFTDLWDSSVTGTTDSQWKVAVASHDVAAYRLTPKVQRLVAKIDTDEKLLFLPPEAPFAKVIVSNPSSKKMSGTVKLALRTDFGEPVKNFSRKVSVPAGSEVSVNFSLQLQPGFYRIEAKVDEGAPSAVNIGYDPTKIVSKTDAPADLREFWDKTLAELAAVAPEFSMKLIPEHSGEGFAQYEVSMKSLGGVEIKGYYTEPVAEGKYPVVVNFMGYGSKPYYLGGSTEQCEFVLSTRGQGINEAEGRNPYGKWIAWHLDNPQEYYYRGAYMDLVRAIDFVCSREKVDTRYVFVQGHSQGGAFSFAASALDHRITAACPGVPFLSDFTDYLKLVNWPAWEIFEGQKDVYNISKEQMFNTLSYFDIKNLAQWIECPVRMAFGLQDFVCPPHTNWAAYNILKVDKDWRGYKLTGHDVWMIKEWDDYCKAFFRSFIK